MDVRNGPCELCEVAFCPCTRYAGPAVSLPEVDEEFRKGFFVVRKTRNPFSAIALDHAHEPENALVKGDAGAVGLTSNLAALRRCMIAGPKIARVVQEFEASVEDTSKSDSLHHE